jgi:hypothetical protein
MSGGHHFSLWVSICVLLLTSHATAEVKIIDSNYTVIAPEWRFALQFPAEEFTVEVEDTRRPYYYFMNKKIGVNVSFNFERAVNCTSSESCRDYFANKLRSIFPEKKNWGMFQLGGIYISENTDAPVSESERKQFEKMTGVKDLANFPIGLDLKQQHWNAHIVKKGIWVDVHLSKVNYQEADRELFTNFVRSIVIRSRD